jgi:hypothetical protein
MASQVDDTIPADGTRPNKADFRQNFETIKAEITELQRETELAQQLAFDMERVL